MKSQNKIYKTIDTYKKWQVIEVLTILEDEFGLNHNDAEKRVKLFYSHGFMPRYYFYSNFPREIAYHIMVLTQLLDANKESVAIETDKGRNITYFYNVGSNIPGKLLAFLEENRDIEIASMDSIITRSGYRIVSLEKPTSYTFTLNPEALALSLKCERLIQKTNEPTANQFLASLPANYMHEEICTHKKAPRILRHFEMYNRSLNSPGIHVKSLILSKEHDDSFVDLGETVRISFAKANPEKEFLVNVITVFTSFNVNLVRTYYDLLIPPDHNSETTVAIGSIYIDAEDDLQKIENSLNALNESPIIDRQTYADENLEKNMCSFIQILSDNDSDKSEIRTTLRKLRDLCYKNSHPDGNDIQSNFLLNALTDFFNAAKLTGIYENDDVIHELIKFEHISEFIVESKNNGKRMNRNGYRLRHSSLRGPGKGGLRIHPIAELSEVAALSFTMTWKCAKSRVRLGGGKGGILMHPKEYSAPMDYTDTVANFGKALFLETGPFSDVPAGDVNCGAREIGMIFDGYKAAFRDLVTLTYTSKFGVAYIGKRIVNITSARKILEENFNIDPFDNEIIHWLMTSEKYLNLVLASQITEKPVMGIEARHGATGLGICYTVFAAVGRLYLDEKWKTDEPLTGNEVALLEFASALSGEALQQNSTMPLISDDDWERMLKNVYPKLLKNKKIILQGSGKVGTSVLKRLQECGVKLIAIADVNGAVVGDHIDIDEVFTQLERESTIINTKKGVNKVLAGADNGASVLTMKCDILLPCALENAITPKNAYDVKATLVVCGANGPVSPVASNILKENDCLEIYDFLANSGGVITSYFEWLRGLAERLRFEAEEIREHTFSVNELKAYVMPEVRNRILSILKYKESPNSTLQWQSIMRDILFAGLNDDFANSQSLSTSLKMAGLVEAQRRVVAMLLVSLPIEKSISIWQSFDNAKRASLKPFLHHPEVREADINHNVAVLSRLKSS